MLSLVVPSYNNLRHLKNLFDSFVRNSPDDVELIMIDDASTDGTAEWMESMYHSHPISFEYNRLQYITTKKRVGHTVLYDLGVEKANHDIIGILHADMYIGPKYVENMMKHIKKGRVVCGTRVEPPLHPPGREKIIQDFGLDFDTLDIKSYEEFAKKQSIEDKDKTTKGMFAPWIMHKEDYVNAGGHDHVFAPFPYEDSDIFQRWILNGYELIQSRDAFVYHLTCRGHKWNEEVGKVDDDFPIFEQNARRNYLRKWGTWIANDEFCHPVIYDKFDIGFVIENPNMDHIRALEPLASDLYGDWVGHKGFGINKYIKEEQKCTMYDISKKFHSDHIKPKNDVVVEFDVSKCTKEDFDVLTNLHRIISDSGEVGKFKIGIFNITIHKMVNQISHLKHAFKLSEEYL
tara:strand:- start:242 stop:1450 length:1209 start_codon:yes stop_codon:yes gene_type:complete